MDTPYELSADEEALYDMSDEDLEAAFREAKSSISDESEEEEAEVVDELEQSTDDSDEEIIDEDDNIEPEEEVVEDEEPEALDEDVEDNSEESVTEDEVVDDNNPPEEEVAKVTEPVKLKYKANGHEYEFTEDEVKEQFGKVFAQAANYTQKMQEIAPWRKTISALTDNSLSHDDVNLMIDVLVNKDKDAIASIIQRTGVDTLDIDTENVSYSPKEYGKSDQELAINDVINNISRDTEYKITQHVVDSQWDSNSRMKLAQNPKMIEGLHDDVKSGVYDKVSPMAMKLKVLDGGSKSDIEYYLEAGREFYTAQRATEQAEIASAEEAKVNQEKLLADRQAIEKAKSDEAKRSATKESAAKRREAAPTKKVAGKKNVVDYLEDSDEAFDDWYKKLQESI